MKDQSQEGGRVNQKRRTREAIVAAAMRLSEGGTVPSIPDVAEEAGVSRATVYRYFPSQEALLIEVALDATTQVIDTSLAQIADDVPATEQVEAVVTAVLEIVVANEPAFRAMLAASLQASLSDSSERPLRGGRRVRWLTKALEPARAGMPEPDFTRLVASLSLLTGIEALVVMKDICGLDSDEAIETAGWAARALIRAALENG